MLTVSVMFSGCTDSTAETSVTDTTQTTTSNEVSTLTYEDPEVVLFNKYDSLNGKHDAYISSYPDRTNDYYSEHPGEIEILDDLASKLDEVIPENYVLRCYIVTYEDDPEYPKCYATILTDRISIDDQFNREMAETVNYINDTYKINRIQMTIIDASTNKEYCWVRTSGLVYEDIRVIYDTEDGEEYRIYYLNRNLDDYTIEKLN